MISREASHLKTHTGLPPKGWAPKPVLDTEALRAREGRRQWALLLLLGGANEPTLREQGFLKSHFLWEAWSGNFCPLCSPPTTPTAVLRAYRVWASPPPARVPGSPSLLHGPLRPFPNRHWPQQGRRKAFRAIQEAPSFSRTVSETVLRGKCAWPFGGEGLVLLATCRHLDWWKSHFSSSHLFYQSSVRNFDFTKEIKKLCGDISYTTVQRAFRQ